MFHTRIVRNWPNLGTLYSQPFVTGVSFFIDAPFLRQKNQVAVVYERGVAEGIGAIENELRMVERFLREKLAGDREREALNDNAERAREYEQGPKSALLVVQPRENPDPDTPVNVRFYSLRNHPSLAVSHPSPSRYLISPHGVVQIGGTGVDFRKLDRSELYSLEAALGNCAGTLLEGKLHLSSLARGDAGTKLPVFRAVRVVREALRLWKHNQVTESPWSADGRPKKEIFRWIDIGPSKRGGGGGAGSETMSTSSLKRYGLIRRVSAELQGTRHAPSSDAASGEPPRIRKLFQERQPTIRHIVPENSGPWDTEAVRAEFARGDTPTSPFSKNNARRTRNLVGFQSTGVADSTERKPDAGDSNEDDTLERGLFETDHSLSTPSKSRNSFDSPEPPMSLPQRSPRRNQFHSP
ncbi:hypothetical protein LTR66_005194 [Elasticomyces elasticus]|nr:hypothetical protein LTR66_005194 [Elasticomyces elasticus]